MTFGHVLYCCVDWGER